MILHKVWLNLENYNLLMTFNLVKTFITSERKKTSSKNLTITITDYYNPLPQLCNDIYISLLSGFWLAWTPVSKQTSVKSMEWWSPRLMGAERNVPSLTRQSLMLSRPHDTILPQTSGLITLFQAHCFFNIIFLIVIILSPSWCYHAYVKLPLQTADIILGFQKYGLGCPLQKEK